ncbi:MAG: ABC transporter ATP-binding protein/permease [Anaerolineaceae bacterium]|nr:ABC transporter ATP-binding protein/permease [Anaerolineaceae bacterium]
MLRLIKYLKPYIWFILLAVVLLFVMANADLALPDYLSRIVNVGIQQSGIESALPQAVRQESMNKYFIFMSDEEKSLVQENFTLIDANSADYESYLAEYPVLSDQPVYVLNKVDQETTDQLIPVMRKSIAIVTGITQMIETPDTAFNMGDSLPFDLTKLPPGADVFSMIGMVPAEQRAQITTRIDETLTAVGDTMLDQVAISGIRTEYDALGLDIVKVQTNYILKVGGLMLLVSLLSGACTVSVGFIAAKTSAGFARDVRQGVFRKVESFSSTEFDSFSTASLITRSTNDVTQIQMVVFMLIRMGIYAPILGIGGVIRAIDKSASMWWIIALAVIILLGLIAIVFVIAVPKFKLIQSLIDRLNLVTRENLSGMMVIRAFNKQGFEEERFDKANTELTKVNLFISRVMVTLMPVMMFIMNGLSILIIWVGAHEIAQSAMQVGDMMAFLQYAMQIIFAFLALAMLFIFLPRAAVSGDRIADVLEKKNIILDPEQPKTFSKDFVNKIEFRNVSFRYPDAEEDILHDINFIAQPGKTTAFIGSTGCGKSTVVNLIPRFYDVSEGSVLVDGIDVRDVTQKDLHDKIGYIPQKGTLFSGTIESNLQVANENASVESMNEAIEIAQASEFVDSNPERLQAEISQGGTNVSGGQKQRLAIARALVKKPPIYIFDDSFSALDFKTDAALRKALRGKMGDSTVLIVTQRVATVKNADQIIVLDDGRVVGKGTHQELMADCQTYQEIALSQLSKEELA